MQKLALFRPRNIHFKGQRAQILFAPWRHQYPLFYSASDITAGQTSRDKPGQTVMRWIKRLMTYSFDKTSSAAGSEERREAAQQGYELNANASM